MNTKLTILKPDTIEMRLEMTTTLKEWEKIRDALKYHGSGDAAFRFQHEIDIVLRKVRTEIDSKAAWEEMVEDLHKRKMVDGSDSMLNLSGEGIDGQS